MRVPETPLSPGPIPPRFPAGDPGIWRRLFLGRERAVAVVRTPDLIDWLRRRSGDDCVSSDCVSEPAASYIVEILASDAAPDRAALLSKAADRLREAPGACVWAVISSHQPLLWRRLLDSAHEVGLQEDRLHPFAPATVAFRLTRV